MRLSAFQSSSGQCVKGLIRATAFCLSLAACWNGIAQAQTTAQNTPSLSENELGIQSPPYDEKLFRLAEILGALHYLRPLCGYDEQDEWRLQMQALIGTEVKNELRRRRFVERFNQSYRGFASVYRRCTDSAEEASRRYADEGSDLISEVISKYSQD